MTSLGLLLVALVAVVGLAKIESPAIENAVAAVGAPASAVGVVIALLVLGLGATQMVLLAITVVVGALTVLPGRATLQEGGVHLAICAAFLFLALNP
jgi:Ca2+:H+ antiporter